MEINGIVKKIFEEKSFSSGFSKRDLVITTQEQYPQHLLIEFLQDKKGLVASLNEGDNVTVSINLRGREWTSPDGVVKYFNSITGWRVQKNSAEENNTPPQSIVDEMPAQKQDFAKDSEADDLPF